MGVRPDTCSHSSKAGDGQARLALNSAGLRDFQQAQCAAEVDSTAPETATPTWGAADTRVQAAFQEAKKKKRKRKKRKRRDSGEQGFGRSPQRRALVSRRSWQAALGPQALPGGPALGPGGRPGAARRRGPQVRIPPPPQPPLRAGALLGTFSSRRPGGGEA